MEIKEEWKDIQGYENLYQISNYGNVKSLWFGKEKILKQAKDTRGYCRVILSKEGKIKSYLVHKLVASTFLPNPQNLPQVNHKNEDKQNNTIDNLEWVTIKQNCNYGKRNEKISKAQSKPILQFNKQGTKILGKYDSATQASNELYIYQQNISYCCKGKRKTAGGYRWMYLEDYVNRMEKLYNMVLKKAS